MSFNEAPASVNVQYKRPDGFVVQLTLRDENGAEVLERLDAALKKIQADGGVAYERQSSFQKKAIEKDYLTDRVCPQDGGKLYKSTTKTGRTVIKCDNGRYDFRTKSTLGCSYTEWL